MIPGIQWTAITPIYVGPPQSLRYASGLPGLIKKNSAIARTTKYKSTMLAITLLEVDSRFMGLLYQLVRQDKTNRRRLL